MSRIMGNKGSWILKALGILALIGAIIAVGSIVMKVFTEDDGTGSDGPTGI